MSREIEFRTFQNGTMFYQGDPDLETLQSFIFHYGDCELMQYTGLKDKNGKKIFEGDILNIDKSQYPDDDDCYKMICFDLGVFIGKSVKKEHYFNLDDLLRDIDYIVIGNIHENQELLKN